MRGMTFLSCVALAGCASSGATAGATSDQETLRISGGAGLPTMTVDTHPTDASAVAVIGASVDKVWSAMKPVYDSLAIPVTSIDPATRSLGNSSLKVRRRLGDTSLSKYVNCGNVQIGASADSYDVVLAVASRAEAGESGSRIITSVSAMGRPITLAGDYSRCTSTGFLEKRIADLVTARTRK